MDFRKRVELRLEAAKTDYDIARIELEGAKCLIAVLESLLCEKD